MNTTQRNFYKDYFTVRITLCATMLALLAFSAQGAAVVSRSTGASSRPTVNTSTRSNIGRMPTTTVSATTSTNETSETEEEPETETVTETEEIIENKSSQFDAVLSSSGTPQTDSSADNLAELVRQQRAELDAQSAITTATQKTQSGSVNACDAGLRTCMQNKCGQDFTQCSGDTDTSWGNKMESCRLQLNCTGEEYRLFAAEIKADRDMNARLASYNAVINCGNQYNNCIMTECGETFSKCLGKTAGDAAISKCKTIADNCVQQDSGLAGRAMQVFANLRQDAEVQIQKDEERLYELRDQMAQQCTSLGAMFDERTFSCVFTVNFYAGDDATLYASKKLYAGDVFSCTPNWFGIDVTTFMENAYRLTREQTSASSALLGSGLGVAAGAITSGAINRAIDRQKAENALKDAEKEHEENFGNSSAEAKNKTDADKQSNEDINSASPKATQEEEKQTDEEKQQAKEEERQAKEDERSINRAERSVTQAEKQETNAKEDLTKAQEDLANAQKAFTSAEQALTDADNALNAATEENKKAAERAQKNAQSAKDKAEKNLEKAKSNLTKAEQALEVATKETSQAQQNLIDTQNNTRTVTTRGVTSR